MCTIITISNHKGGVGKTTSTANIGAGLNNHNKKVLLIDLDPQANLSQHFNIADEENNVYKALIGKQKLKPIVILKDFHIVPSTLDLSGAEMELINEAGREFILKELLSPLKNKYDYIFIDNPPSLGLLTINSFTASNLVFVPLQAEYLALQGLKRLLKVIDKVKQRLNKNLNLGGIFITQYDNRKILNRDVLETIKEHFEDKLFQTKIRNNVNLAEAPSKGQDIFRYKSDSIGGQDYASLVKEILKMT